MNKKSPKGWIALAVVDLIVIGYTCIAFFLHRGMNTYFLSIRMGAVFARSWQPAALVSLLLILVTVILVTHAINRRQTKSKLVLTDDMQLTETGKIKTATASVLPSEADNASDSAANDLDSEKNRDDERTIAVSTSAEGAGKIAPASPVTDEPQEKIAPAAPQESVSDDGRAPVLIRYCGKCGEKVDGDSVFCANCGARLEGEA
ncbi:MAG: zinc ribbon domain-containing protein [Lachnospiraceae bacterium]|nr:zinc ribbon domain-containing protein [Lachnospiraceae bacterium]